MNKVCKTIGAILTALCLVCACLPVSVYALPDACGDNVSMRYDSETDSVIFYGSGPMYDFELDSAHVPQTYTRVVIEPGVTYVGSFLFTYDAIGELVMPDTPLTVNAKAFYDCSIDKVTFPQTAVNAAQYSINSYLGTFGSAVVYGADLGGLDAFPSGFGFEAGDNYDLRSLVVGANTTQIPDNACNCFGALESLTLPEGLLSIGAGAFESCECLTSVTIPDSVTTISDYAFDYCVNLEEVTLPKQLLTIGEWAFCSCEKLTSVTIPSHTTSIGASAFEDCASLAEVTIPDSVTSIGSLAFSGTALQSVHLPAGLQTIEADSFGDSLTYVCCNTDDCPAVKQFAADAGFEFRLCDGHSVEPRVSGDANGDGVLNLKDTVLIRRYLADWDVEIDESAADVDGDGEVTLQDVTILNRYLAGGWDVELV